jgi:hypothetical protein
MANQPAILGTVKVTAKDINGGNVAKQFNNVSSLHFDYAKGMVRVIDATGQFYFSLMLITTLTYTVNANPGGSHVVVMS